MQLTDNSKSDDPGIEDFAPNQKVYIEAGKVPKVRSENFGVW